MGKRGMEIVGLDVGLVIAELRSAFSDEWLAHYQYWVGAKVVKGPMKEAVIAELLQHAADELRHADLVAMRIIQLGGEPVINPKQWFELSGCGYDEPANPFVKNIIDQNIKGEQCAISSYTKLLEMTKDKDVVTYNMVLQILSDEVEHEEDLQALAEDFEMLIKYGVK